MAYDASRNADLAIPMVMSKYADKIAATKTVLAGLNGGEPLPIVPAEWADSWIVRFLIGFKEDPELAGEAFFKAQRWRAEHNIEAIRQKILAGMQPQDFPHARKVQPYLPRQQHGCCRHGLPVEYTFCGCIEPELLLKAASFDEILLYFIYDAEYKLNRIQTLSLERNVLVRLQNVFDAQGFSMTKHLNRKNVGVLKQAMDEITPRYVEMVEKVMIINCPLAKVVKPIVNYVVPARALHKFSISGGAWYDGVTAHIDAAELHPCLQPGGPSVHDALQLSVVDATANMHLKTVAAGKKVEFSAPVPAGMDVSYSFMSKGHDVGLSVAYQWTGDGGGKVQVVEATRIKGNQASLHGRGGGGVLTVVLDNQDSWMRKKEVCWLVEPVAPVQPEPL